MRSIVRRKLQKLKRFALCGVAQNSKSVALLEILRMVTRALGGA
jgi:hypothetical protein